MEASTFRSWNSLDAVLLKLTSESFSKNICSASLSRIYNYLVPDHLYTSVHQTSHTRHLIEFPSGY
jgi:hypothetical protein